MVQSPHERERENARLFLRSYGVVLYKQQRAGRAGGDGQPLLVAQNMSTRCIEAKIKMALVLVRNLALSDLKAMAVDNTETGNDKVYIHR